MLKAHMEGSCSVAYLTHITFTKNIFQIHLIKDLWHHASFTPMSALMAFFDASHKTHAVWKKAKEQSSTKSSQPLAGW